MRLFVTEKPSVARDLARALGARRRGDCFEGEHVRVVWCLGHLVEHAPPDAHDPSWKRWDPQILPMLPEQMLLQPVKRTAGHFRSVARALNARDVREVVNACDAGREGELIFRYVYELARCRKPTLRFWVSSLTPGALRAGLNALRPGRDYDPLGAAARCRAEADWLVGMNATRGLTSRADGLLSVGRVQTPTLAMIVRREEEIEAFVPEDFWVVETRIQAELGRVLPQSPAGLGWRAWWIGPSRAKPPKPTPGKLKTAAEAEALVRQLRGAPGRVHSAERKVKRVPPPLLHHLTSLQQQANRRHGLTADQTLKAAQALYERHKLLTYPRTDSRHLTPDVAATLPRVVAALQPAFPKLTAVLPDPLPRLGPRYVNAAKVGDHHAIIPTTVKPTLSALGRAERQVYELVVRRTLAALCPNAVHAKTELLVEAPLIDGSGQWLRARGSVCLDPGWERVEAPPKRKDLELPAVNQGDPVRVDKARLEARKTEPPRRYDEASLLQAMEHAGRKLDDDALRAAMKDCGLGTPATRASIIETLLRRGYIRRDKKLLLPQSAGRILIGALPVPALKSAELTAEWERRLHDIADGRADPQAFRFDIRRFVAMAVQQVLAGPRVSVPGADRKGRGKGKRGRRRGRRAAPDRGRAAPKPRKAPAKKATPRKRAPRKAAPPPSPHPAAPGNPKCPKCGEARLVTGKRGWGCPRWREGCDFVVWFEQDGVRVPDEEAAKLFKGRRQTNLFHRREGASWRLVLDLEAPGNCRWVRRKR